MLEHLPHRAAQVQELELAFCFNPDFDKRALLNMFPNLRYLNLTEISNDFPAKDYISKPFQFMHSTSKLKSVCDIGECELTYQLAISNLGQHLKLLDLVFRNSPIGSYDRVILQLKNMPVLQCLKLSDCPFDLMNMEILHTNLSSIIELQMHSSLIAPSEVPRDIEPATPITSLFFSLEYLTGNKQSHIGFYKYLAKKYPSTNDFICFDCVLRDRSIQYVCDVFDDGIIPFLEQVGPQLRDFSFESNVDGIAAFGRIDELGCKFKELTISSYHDDEYLFEELTESDQAKTIEVLELNDTVPNPAEYLISMEVLRFLRIDCSNSNSMDEIGTSTELDLNKLLRSYPLRSLVLLQRTPE